MLLDTSYDFEKEKEFKKQMETKKKEEEKELIMLNQIKK